MGVETIVLGPIGANKEWQTVMVSGGGIIGRKVIFGNETDAREYADFKNQHRIGDLWGDVHAAGEPIAAPKPEVPLLSLQVGQLEQDYLKAIGERRVLLEVCDAALGQLRAVQKYLGPHHSKAIQTIIDNLERRIRDND